MSLNRIDLQRHSNSAQFYPPPPKTKEIKGKNTYFEIEPEKALNWSFEKTVNSLSSVIGRNETARIFNGGQVESPVKNEQNGDWLKETKIVGINPRAIGSYFDIVKYAMTFPEESIHLLPLFEQGCQGSLYAPVNFKLSDEFMDKDLAKIGFDTPEKQLKLVLNLLHAMGKTVGMDFLQHTDRFSEEVFVNPDYFIWAQLDEDKTRELEYPEIHPDKTGNKVKDAVIDFIRENGDANGNEVNSYVLENLYKLSEEKRRKIIFGDLPASEKTDRRVQLMNFVRERGFETKPVHLDDPKTKIVFDKMQKGNGTSWATFKDGKKNRFFGNLTPYKLYHLDENGNTDTTRPNKEAWDYLCQKTGEFQKEYGFDFLRADMGYLNFGNVESDIHSAIKDYAVNNNGCKSFASFGECFSDFAMSDREALKRKKYDALLGNVQYLNVFDENFVNTIKGYNFNPDYKISVTSITADSDQAVYNKHYDNIQNKIRCFMGLFLNQPSYMGMGLETRDVGPVEGKNLTKDFINDWGIEKYEWGKNKEFFGILSGMRKIYAEIKDVIKNNCHYWLNTNNPHVASWFYYTKDENMPTYLFVSNADNKKQEEVDIQNLYDTNISSELSKKTESVALSEIYSTEKKTLTGNIVSKGRKFKVKNLAPGECRVYKVVNPELIEKYKNENAPSCVS